MTNSQNPEFTMTPEAFKALQKTLGLAKNKSPENDVKKACMDWLNAHGMPANRQQSGKVKAINPHAKRAYWMQLAEEGSGDIVSCSKGRFVEIETKAPGGKQSPVQKRRQCKVEAAGGIYILAYSSDDLHVLL